jgi:uncharacterized protein YndB with AHSA1/START domain
MHETATMIDGQTVQFVRILPGPVEKIWDYLADGKKRGEWFVGGALPARVGEKFEGHFKHSDLSPNHAPPPPGFEEMDANGKTMSFTLLACEPPHRLAFTFGPDTEVEFRLKPEGDPKDNKVRLTLTHSKLPDQKFTRSISGGWTAHLDILEDKANGRVPPAFWDVWRKADAACDARCA